MLIVGVSEVKLPGEAKQNNLPPKCGQPIDVLLWSNTEEEEDEADKCVSVAFWDNLYQGKLGLEQTLAQALHAQWSGCNSQNIGITYVEFFNCFSIEKLCNILRVRV
jgi:hypothetical protein